MSVGRLQTNVNVDEPAVDSILVYARSATQRIYVQKITYTPTDFTSGAVLNFVNSTTQVSIGRIVVIPVAVGEGTQYELDFNPNGTVLPVGANLQLSIVSGGVSGRLIVTAYQLPLYVRVPYVAPGTAGKTV